jgi:hypothetical protein
MKKNLKLHEYQDNKLIILFNQKSFMNRKKEEVPSIQVGDSPMKTIKT